MNSDSPENRGEEERILRLVIEGDHRMLGELLQRYHPRLRRMLRLRMDRRLQGRVDPSDIIQEAYTEASQRIEDYLEDPAVPFYVWLRFLAVQRPCRITDSAIPTRHDATCPSPPAGSTRRMAARKKNCWGRP